MRDKQWPVMRKKLKFLTLNRVPFMWMLICSASSTSSSRWWCQHIILHDVMWFANHRWTIWHDYEHKWDPFIRAHCTDCTTFHNQYAKPTITSIITKCVNEVRWGWNVFDAMPIYSVFNHLQMEWSSVSIKHNYVGNNTFNVRHFHFHFHFQ